MPIVNFFKKPVISGIIAIIILASFSSGAYYFGYQKGVQNPKITTIEGVANLDKNKEESVDFSLFWDAWQKLKEKFVNTDKLDNQELVYGAISGLFAATNDPYSVFMKPSDAKKFDEEISGQFGGIGAELGLRENQLLIIAPLKNTPAEKAGIKAGDKILEINKETTAGITVEEAVNKIRGKKGTKVNLLIYREKWKEPRSFEIIRDIIQVPTLDWKMYNESGKEDSEGKIIYAQLYNFYERAPMLFYQMVLQTSFKNPKGIIIDLRNNPGGYLEAAVSISGWFLEKDQVVVKEKFSSGEVRTSKNPLVGFYKDIPVVVLINEGSASASEIMAGALRDNRGIKLVGAKSFGKGSVQELEQLKGGSFVKITIAKWLTPKDHIIDKDGLTPDFEVKINGNVEQTEKETTPKDLQLEKAFEVLKPLIK